MPLKIKHLRKARTDAYEYNEWKLMVSKFCVYIKPVTDILLDFFKAYLLIKKLPNKD